jgi:acetyl-CoA carboxylase biotin carboxyl carrier protein
MMNTKKKTEVAVGTKFSVEEISQILELMRENEVNEFRLELGEGKLFLKRGSDIHIAAPAQVAPAISYAAPQQYQPQSAPQQASQPFPMASAPLAPTPAAVLEKKYHELKSPMVGTFYRRPSPDASPYAQVGDVVKKGQTLCIVEAMKLMNEIQSDVSGKVVESLLEDGQMAEYGEVLFRIDTGA